MNFDFERWYSFISLPRSGHNAVCHWVLSNCIEPSGYMNNLATLPDNAKSLDINRINAWYGKNKLHRSANGNRMYAVGGGYEDKSLNEVIKFEQPLKEHAAIHSKKFFGVLIIRDYFNWLASAIKHGRTGNNLHIELWREQARAAIDLVKLPAPKSSGRWCYRLPSDYIVVLFDYWVRDKKYRQDLAKLLDVGVDDVGVDDVPEYGGGSSFDRMEYQGKASEMEVTERWRLMLDNDQYKNVIRHNSGEAIAMNEVLFGVNEEAMLV
jgi:hypothetical protein